MVGVKLWLVVGGHGELMPGRGWSWVVVGGGDKIMAGRWWSQMIVDGRDWSHDLVMSFKHYQFLRLS